MSHRRALLDRVAGWRDPALAAGLCALGQVELWSGATYAGDAVWPGPRPVSAVLIVALTAPLAWRRRRPTTVTAVVLGLLGLSCAVLGGGESTTEFLLFVVTAFTAAAYARAPVALGAAALLVGAVHELRDPDVSGPGDVLWAAGMLSVAWLLGLAVRTRILRIGRLESQATATRREHAERVAEATAAERAAIARELHDIVSHAVAVVVIQAQVGQRALPHDASRAAQALDTIERTGRDALTELRRLLTLLSEHRPAVMTPAASLDRLDELVAGYRASGLDVQVTRDDDLPLLAQASDLAAYRIVQEALTNVVRHAGSPATSVLIRRAGGGLEIQVDNEAPRPPRAGWAPFHAGRAAVPPGTGRGLIGMRERLALVGGELLHAGPYGEGYRVLARLPVEEPSAVPEHEGIA